MPEFEIIRGENMTKYPVIIPYMDHDEVQEVEKVISTGWVAQGPKVAEFEQLVARYEHVNYGVAVTSCTTALHLALLAMGIGEGHDCLVPSFTFIATPNSVTYTGARPVFVDVCNDTYNINVEEIERIISQQYSEAGGHLINKISGNELKVIIAVSLFGLCADLPRINALAKKHHLQVLQDSACAFGAKIDNVFEAEFGNPSCLSFHPRKSITTGEGGMVLTEDKALADKVRMLRSHAASVSEVDRHKNAGYLLPDFNELGYNYRMTDIQAAVGVAQMRKMDYITGTRREKAHYYDGLIEKMDWKILRPPYIPQGCFSTYQSYVCVLDYKQLGFETITQASLFRNDLMQSLEDEGIATRVGTHATHMLGYYKERFGFADTDFPGAYELDRLSITLPLYVQMNDEDQRFVISEIERIVRLKLNK